MAIRPNTERSIKQWKRKYFNLCKKWHVYKIQGNEQAASYIFEQMMGMNVPVGYLMNQQHHS